MKLVNVMYAALLGAMVAGPLQAADAPLTPEKQKAAKELLATLDVKRSTAQLKELMFRQWLMAASSAAPRAINEDKTLSDEQKKKLMGNGEKVMKIMGDDFKTALDKVDMTKILEGAAAEAYSKSLTEQEMREVAAFNNTATGKKLQQLQPQISADAMKLATERAAEQLRGAKQTSFADMVKKIDSAPAPAAPSKDKGK
ncbi:hypothetical protein HNQ59_000159 [Chitinivorax tropicus]|uniref:DUF2059 domain-containing protein n=1 Tax=Chitinivorax tropicus TaxID=714531 RepID=A0A840MJC3_9PROT|nr:DUF2059 domain-containing protein [Chitinivorax tropicus]MBB5016897.1 hypothetical protein [Chitinivorax tropicus]